MLLSESVRQTQLCFGLPTCSIIVGTKASTVLASEPNVESSVVGIHSDAVDRMGVLVSSSDVHVLWM